jgi:hypothetical protein
MGCKVFWSMHLPPRLPLGVVRATHAFLRCVASAALLALVVTMVACDGAPHADRTGLLERADAKRLIGAWDVTLVLERSITPLDDARDLERSVPGTIAFTENRGSELEVTDFGVVTHKGVYDLDLTSFRLPAADDGRFPYAIARTTALRSTQERLASVGGDDSVSVALSPGDSHLSIRLTGLLTGDTIAGAWIAEFVRSQASGRFVMRRHRA